MNTQTLSNTTEDILREARFRLRRLIWISALSVVSAYLGGHIHSAYVDAKSHNNSVLNLANLVVQKEKADILQDVMLGQKESINKRILMLEVDLRRKLLDESLCVNAHSPFLELSKERCQNMSLTALPVIDLMAGEQTIVSLEIQVNRPDEIEQAIRTSANSLLVVLISALIGVWLLYFLAERNVLKPLIEVLRKRERDVAIAGTVQMLAHDIRKPISMIDILLSQLKDAATTQDIKNLCEKYSPSIHKSNQTLSIYIDNILAYGHESEVHRQPSDISVMIKQSFEDLRLIKNTPSLQMELLALVQGHCHIDEAKMKRVVDNLLSNAIDASGPNGQLKTTICQTPGHLEIIFENRGPCIEVSRLSLIFEPYFTSGKRSGTGLGLAIAKKFVEAHGGRIHCENIPGYGVRFVISLPLGRDSQKVVAERPLEREVSSFFDAFPKTSVHE